MDPFTQALRDPTLAETLEEDMNSTGTTLAGSLNGHAPAWRDPDKVPPGTLTIDLDLPPVDAAPKHKGPRWRLRMLLEWTREAAEERRRSRRLQQAAGIWP
jgi:hypothetical protein